MYEVNVVKEAAINALNKAKAENKFSYKLFNLIVSAAAKND